MIWRRRRAIFESIESDRMVGNSFVYVYSAVAGVVLFELYYKGT